MKKRDIQYNTATPSSNTVTNPSVFSIPMRIKFENKRNDENNITIRNESMYSPRGSMAGSV